MTISQEMTQTQKGGRAAQVPLAFSALMTFSTPKAMVNVLPYYEMSWVYSITTVSSTCACTHTHTHTHTQGPELEQGCF